MNRMLREYSARQHSVAVVVICWNQFSKIVRKCTFDADFGFCTEKQKLFNPKALVWLYKKNTFNISEDYSQSIYSRQLAVLEATVYCPIPQPTLRNRERQEPLNQTLYLLFAR